MNSRQDDETNQAPQVALPNQIPQSLKTPVETSATLELVIQQNQDLMARLSISLRRCAEYELRLKQNLELNRGLQTQNDSLRDEVSCLQQKYKKFEETLQMLKTQRQTYQARFDETLHLYQSSLVQIERLQRYRSRIRKWVAPLLKKSAQKFKNSEAQGQSLVYQNLQNLKRLSEQDVQLKDLNKKLADLEQQFTQDLQRLTEFHEERLALAKSETAQDRATVEKANEKSLFLESQVRNLEDAKVLLENRTVFAERRLQETEKKLEIENEKMRAQLLEARGEAHARKIENERLRESIHEFESQIAQVREEKQSGFEKQATLKYLLEEEKNSKDSLQKKIHILESLNREIHLQLRESRSHVSNPVERINEQLISERGELGDIID